MIKELKNKEEFLKCIEENEYVFVQWYEPWCPFCKEVEDMMESLVKEYSSKIPMVRIRPAENKLFDEDIAVDRGTVYEKMYCSVVPTFAIFESGSLLFKDLYGTTRENLVRIIEYAIED